MNVVEVAALFEQLPRRGRLLGVDFGTKRIGLAVSDVERRVATSLATIERVGFAKDAAQLAAAADAQDAAAIVIGLPLNMDGTEGPRVQSTRAFVRNMERVTSRPFVFWDERLSTAAVTRELIAQDASRARRQKVVDRMAAAYILQGVLDRLSWLAREKNEAAF